MISNIYGAIRLGIVLLIVLLAAVAALITSLVPVQIRGAPLVAWSVHYVIRLLFAVFGIRVKNSAPERLREHAGLVFPNHMSVLDALSLYHCTPLRLLSASDLAERLVIGWIVKKVGTVFVTREDRASRKRARVQIAEAIKASPRPPVVLFPEGRLGTGRGLYPFRHGAFEIAIENEIPYLPCALTYKPLEVAVWRAAEEGETMWQTVWRMVQYRARIEVKVIPLSVVHPKRDDSAEQLANDARAAIADVLGLPLDAKMPD